MNPEARLAEILARMAEIQNELRTAEEAEARFSADADANPLAEDHAERVAALTTEFDSLDEERSPLQIEVEKRERIRNFAGNPGNRLDGDGARAAAPVVDRNKTPWDYDELRAIGTGPHAVSELRARAASAIEKVARLTDDQRQKTTQWLETLTDEDGIGESNARALRHVLAVSAPEYARAFNSAVGAFARTGVTNGPGSDVLARAMSLTDAAGGYAVPLPIDPTIVVNDDGTESPFREISTVKTITTDKLRTVNVTAVSASWDGEAAEVSDDAPTFANIDITAHKAQAFVPFSIEAGQDFPDLQGTIGGLIATEKGDLEAAAHATGTGSSQPFGIVTALAGGSYEVTSNTTDTFAIGDVYDLNEELPSKFSRRARWAANKKIYQAIREAGGANLDDFWANLGQGMPPQLLGSSAHEASAMDGVINAAADNYVLVYGDFSYYWIVDRVGLSVELVPHLFATANNLPSGQRGLYAHWRTGADSVNDRAFRLLNVT